MKRSLLNLLLPLLFCFNLTAQKEFQRYRKEPGQVFKFDNFQRGFAPQKVRKKLDQLAEKDKAEWNRNDSIRFAIALLQTGRHLKSAKIFNRIPSSMVVNRNNLKYKIMAFEKSQKFGLAISLIEKLAVRIPSSQIQWGIWKKCLKARKNIKLNKPNNFEKEPLLPMNAMLKMNRTKLLDVITSVDQLLHFMIRFYIDDDEIMGEMCYELGIIFKEKLTLSQAYISLSLARNYTKGYDKILRAFKEVKAELNKNRYEIPQFRTVFPRVKEGQFDYNLLKQKELKEQEINPKKHIDLIESVEDENEGFFSFLNTNLIITISFFLVLIGVLLAVRSKK